MNMTDLKLPAHGSTIRNAGRILYILGLAILMVSMALIQEFMLPLVSQRPWTFHRAWVILGLLWIVFLSLLLRRLFSGNWFFFWGPLGAVVCIIVVYLGANLTRCIYMGSHDKFPGMIIMLPTIGMLLCISFVALVVRTLAWRRRTS